MTNWVETDVVCKKTNLFVKNVTFRLQTAPFDKTTIAFWRSRKRLHDSDLPKAKNQKSNRKFDHSSNIYFCFLAWGRTESCRRFRDLQKSIVILSNGGVWIRNVTYLTKTRRRVLTAKICLHVFSKTHVCPFLNNIMISNESNHFQTTSYLYPHNLCILPQICAMVGDMHWSILWHVA